MRISDWSSDVCSSDLDQRLAVGPRDQRAGADGEADRPEVAIAEDIGDGFVRQPPRDQRLEAIGHGEARGIEQDRQSAVEGKSVSVRVDLGGRRTIKKKKLHIHATTENRKRRKN